MLGGKKCQSLKKSEKAICALKAFYASVQAAEVQYMATAWTKYRLSEQLQFQAGGEPITQLFLEFFFRFFHANPSQ